MNKFTPFTQNKEEHFNIFIDLDEPTVTRIGIQANHKPKVWVFVFIENLVVGIYAIFELLHFEHEHASGNFDKEFKVSLHNFLWVAWMSIVNPFSQRTWADANFRKLEHSCWSFFY